MAAAPAAEAEGAARYPAPRRTHEPRDAAHERTPQRADPPSAALRQPQT